MIRAFIGMTGPVTMPMTVAVVMIIAAQEPSAGKVGREVKAGDRLPKRLHL